MLRFSCPRCQTVLECPDEQAGAKITCTTCEIKLLVPARPGGLQRGTLPPSPPASRYSPAQPPPSPSPEPGEGGGGGEPPAPDVVLIRCPSCDQALSVARDRVGSWVKCATCGVNFPANMPAAPSALAPAASGGLIPLQKEDPVPPPLPPIRRRRRRRLDDDERYDPYRRRDDKPGKVQAIGIMTLIGGIVAALTGAGLLALGLTTCLCLLWPGTYYSLVMGIMAITKGTALLGDHARYQGPPQGMAVMQIINIVNGDVVNLVFGILTLVFLNDPEVEEYFHSS